MKIGYLNELDINLFEPPYDGPANHVRHVISELLERGHTVRLLFRFDGRIWASDDLAGYRQVASGIQEPGPMRAVESAVRRVQFEMHLPYIGLFESRKFANACWEQLKGCDLLYQRNSWMTYGGALAARRLKVPLVLEDNGDALVDLEAKGASPEGLQLLISKAVMGRAIRSASHIVSTGDGWRDMCISRWHANPDQVTVVENGTSLVSLLGRSDLRAYQHFGTDDRATRLVYVGGFLPWHGVDLLLGAFAGALSQIESLKLLLIGSGPGFNAANARAKELGISGAVDFAGQLLPADYAPLIARCDIGLSPYCGWPEYSGLKILDYKAAGLATIASGGDGRPKTVDHGRTGLIVPPCDEDALLGAILHIAEDRELRLSMGKRAREQAERCHRWSNTVDHIEDIFAAVLAQSPGRILGGSEAPESATQGNVR